jgi:tetratricopeptide (TPR) repeat protein
LFTYSIASFPRTPENYVNYSSYLIDSGDYLGAIRPLQCAIEFSDGNKDKLYNNLATCLIAVKKYDKAYFYSKLCYETTTDTILKPKLRDQMVKLNDKVRKANRLIKQLQEV